MNSPPIWLRNYLILIIFTTNMRNICHKTRALDRPRFPQEKQKNLAYILSYFSNLCFLFCSNTLILTPECRKYILRVPNFQNFPGGGESRAPLEFCTNGASSSPFSTFSYNFATYSDSYWKPCLLVVWKSSTAPRNHKSILEKPRSCWWKF